MPTARNHRLDSPGSQRAGPIMLAVFTLLAIAIAVIGSLPTSAQEDSRAVGAVRVESNQSGELDVSWDAPTDTPHDYRVNWARVGENFPTWTDSSGNAFPMTSSYTITGLDQGVRYKVRVRARYDGPPGAWSGTIEAVVALAAPSSTATDTATPIPVDTATSTSTATDTATPIPVDAATSTSTATDTATPIPVDAATSTSTATDTATPIPVDAATSTSTATDTATPIPVDTATSTSTATDTATPIPVDTATSTSTATDTATPIPADTATSTSTATDTATSAPADTATSTSTATGTATSAPADTATSTLAVPVLTAEAADGKVELSWGAVQGATRYELWVWTNNDDWQQIGGENLTDTTYSHDGLTAGTTYIYTIRAVNADGETSAWSQNVPATPPQGQQSSQHTSTPTATVTSVSPTATTVVAEEPVWSADMLVVEYTTVSIGAASADLFSNVGGSAGLQIKSLWSYTQDRDLRLEFVEGVPGAEDLTLQVGDLVLAFPAGSSGQSSFKWHDVDVDWEDGQTISVRIVSTSATDTATPIPADTATSTLAAPTLTAEAADGKVKLSWGAVQGATRYELWVWTNSDDWLQIGGENLTDTTYIHDGLTAGTTYIYTIRAVNAAGETGAWSENVSTTPQQVQVPKEPQDTPTLTATATATLWIQVQVVPTVTSTATPRIQVQDWPTVTSTATPRIQVQDWPTATATATPGFALQVLSTATPTATAAVTPQTISCANSTAIPDPEPADLVADCETLLGLKDELVGSGTDLNWSEDTLITNWTGVTVSSERVTDLNLPDLGLAGTIPTELGNLTNLKTLNLGNNDLTGSIPTELGSLANLTGLYLNSNSLSGSIPIQVGSLTNLEYLDLSYSSLTGSIPTELGSLTSLKDLLLNDNNLTGSIPTELGSLTNLESLDLANNSLTESIPTQLGSLTSLKDLLLNDNNLTGSIPTQLGSLAKLQTLDLSDNDLTGTIPTELGNLTNLELLDLSGNDLTGSIPTELGSLTNLTDLDLHGNDLTGSIPTELGSLTNLTDLDLHGNDLTGSIPTELGSLTNLEYLTLGLNNLTGNIPTEFGSLTNLEYLFLRFNNLNGSIPTELGSLTNLEELWLDYNDLTGSIPTELGNLTNLERLALSNNELTGSIPTELGSLTNLELLDLSDNALTGSIPTELDNLVPPTGKLDRVKIPTGNFALCGSIPSDLHGLVPTDLGSTDLDSNSYPDGTIPCPTFSYEQSSYSVGEGSSVAITVTLSVAPDRTVTIPITSTNQAGASNSDYSGVPNSLTFNIGNTARSFAFSATQDFDNDDNESVKLAFGTLPTGIGAGTHSETTVNITDDDDLSTVSYDQSSYSVGEGSSVAITVTLSAAPVGAVTIPITRTNQGGASDSDYSGVPNSLTFNSGDTEKSFTFSATQDGDYEDNESVKLTFGTLPTGVSAGTYSEATVNITDDDLLRVTVSYEKSSYSVGEGSSVPITITLSAALDRTVMIPITRTNQGGASDSDYSGVPNSLTFNGGDTEKSFTFSATQDADNDEGESVKLAFGALPAGVTAGTHSEATVNICTDAASQKAALTALYNATGGASWTVNTNWLSNEPVDAWHGVTSDDGGCVTRLELEENGLSGSIPTELGNLANLRILNLGFNSLTGSIPTQLGSLTNLVQLLLGKNDLTGSIPTQLGSLTNLEDLDLSGNDLTGNIPTQLGSLANLRSMTLGNNSLTGSIPTELGSLTNLQFLTLGGNALTGSIPTELGSLTNLESLYLAQNVLSGSIPTELGNLANLRTLSLGFNSLTGSIPTQLGNLTNLVDLWLGVNALTGSIPTELGSLTNLTSLNLRRNDLTGSIPNELGNLTNLTSLDLDRNDLTGSIPNELGNLTNLTDLDLTDNALTGNIPTELGNLVPPTGNLGSVEIATGNFALCGPIPSALHSFAPTFGDNDLDSNSFPDGTIPCPTFSYGQSSYTVGEGGSIAITVILSVEPDRTVTIPITRTNQGSASNSDYSGVPNSLTFDSGDTEKSFTFSATQDADNDDGESVKLGFGTLPTGIGAGTYSEATVNITDDTTVGYEQPSYSVGEGNSVAITVTLSAAPVVTVTIPITRTNQSGASNADYSGVPSSLTFSSGDTEKSFTFSATQDTDIDGGESVKLGFGTLPTGIGAGTYNEATVNITDDDLSVTPTATPTATPTVTPQMISCANSTAIPDPEPADLVADCETLLGLKGELAGISIGLNWSEDTLIANWTGVTVSSDRVTVLNLPNLRLEGTIPTELGDLTNLKTLNLGNNDLTGSIPTELGNLANLEYLDLSNTRLTGSIPTELGSLTSLKDLLLHETNLTGTIPTELGDLTNLKTLNLGDNDLTGSIPTELGSLANLTGLYLNSTDLSGSIPTELGSLTNLEYLDLSWSSLTGSIPTELGSLTSLKDLLLHENFLSGGIPTELGSLTNLEHLDLVGGSLTGSIPTELGSLTNLKKLHLGFNFLTGSIPTELGSLTNLERLDLYFNNLTGSIPTELGSLTNLQNLDLSFNALSGSIPTELGSLTNLQNLDLSFNALSGSIPTELDSLVPSTGSLQSVMIPTGNFALCGTIPSALHGFVPPSNGFTDLDSNSYPDGTIPCPTFSYEQSSYTVGEGNSVAITITLSVEPDRTVTIPITSTSQGGASNADYSGVPNSLTFDSGDTEKSFTFIATQDTDNDDSESVKLAFGTLPTGISAGTHSEATVNITDDDDPEVTVGYEQSSYSVGEGSSVAITVTLSMAPEGTVTIPITSTNQGGASDSDYSGVPNSLTFNIGDTAKSFTFSATQDTDIDGGESVKLAFGTLPTGIGAGTYSEATVNITECTDTASEKAALTALYNATGGASWTVNTNWLSNEPIGDWHGVQSDDSGCVTSLNLQGNGLSGSMPTELGSLAALQRLVLYNNQLTGSIPTQLGSLTNLQWLFLETNDLTGTIPKELGSLTNLQDLRLSDNDLTGTIPTELGNLANLGGLNLRSNSLTGSIPTELGNLANLGSLDLSSNSLTGSIPTELGSLAKLGSLDLEFNGLTGSIPTELGSLANLSGLDLRHNSLTGSIPTELGSLTNLGSLDLRHNSLTGSIPTELGSLTNLTSLHLGANGLTGSLPTELGNLTNLRVLWLDNNALTGSIPTELDNLVPPTGMLFSVLIPTGNFALCGPIPSALHGLVPPSYGFNDLDSNSYSDGTIPCPTFSYEQSSYTVGEGSSVAITVTLSVEPDRTVTIPITSTNQVGASNADYSGVPNSLTFNSGETAKSFTFSATQDTDNDDNESVKLAFGTLPTGISAGTYSETTVNITDDDLSSVTVSYQQSSYSVGEGSSVAITVTLSMAPEGTVTIPITSTNQSGASNADYSGVPSSLTFNSGDTEKSFTFSATQDTDNDDGESVKLGFGTLPTGVSAGTTNETTVNITDDDLPSVTVGYQQSSYSVGEGSSVAITVTLSAAPERTVTIPITRTNQAGASNADYSGVPSSLTFNSGDTEKSFTFSATQDTDNDDNESVKLGFGTLPTGVSAGTTNETTVNITDDDLPSVTVGYQQSSYSVGEGSSVAITMTLSTAPERTVTIPIATTNQSGASNADYSGVPSSLTFNSGDTAKSFTFSATQDTDNDDGESVKLGFGTLPTGVSTGTYSEATVNITDDDLPAVTVSYQQSSYSVSENSSVTVKVTLSAAPERTVTIPITRTNQAGASNADYSGVPNSLTFNSGDTEKSFTFSAAQDTDNDDGESVKLGFGTLPTGVSTGTYSEATVNITDDDLPAVTVSYQQSSYSVGEGSSVVITMTLSAAPERTVTIPIARTNQAGASNADYSGVPNSLTFNSGDTEKSFTFSATQDTDNDDNESVKLAFGTLPTGVSAGTTSETTVNITDDDLPSVTVSYQQSSYSVGEGSSVVITMTLSAAPERTVTIPIARTNQSGASNADYSGVPSSLTFNSGDTEKSFTFSATQDTDNDDNESVKLGFGTLPTGVSAGTHSETTVSITDDDVPSVTVSYQQSSYSVGEGSSVAITMTLSAAPERTVTIPIARTNQSGASNADYSGVPSSLTFNSGDTEKSFTFSATQDTDNDDNESVKLGFGTLPTGVSAGTHSETTVSITDDDVPSVTVSYQQSSYSVGEGSSVAITMTLSAAPERTVTIPIARTNQSGASNADYSGVPSSLTFNSGDTEKSFTFSATQDTDNDDGESVKLGFGTLPTGVSTGTYSETTVNITDDDLPAVTVSYQQSSYTVSENSSVTVKVTLSMAPDRTVTIPITRTNQGGASNADYSGVPSSLTFNSGDTEKSFTFSATQDTDNDDNESVKLGFGTLPTGVSAGTTNETTVNITDDDLPSVTVGYQQSSYSVGEGSSVVITMTLSAAPERTVTIPITRTNQAGATNADYSGVPSSLTFNSGDTEKSFTFSATQDTDNDDNESVKLGFGTLPTGVSTGTYSEATVNITDDDLPAVTVSYQQSSYSVGEGSSVVITMTLSAAPERTVTIPIARTNQAGASNADYSGVPNSLTFNSGDTEKSFTFSATQDTDNDDNESVKLAFGTLPTGVSTGTYSETTVNITDDDLPAVTVSYQQSSYTVSENSSVTVKVTLSAAPERTVTIPITRTNQAGASNADYSGVPNSLTFNSGDTEKSFTFSAAQDTDNDDDESVKLGFGTLPTGVSAGTTNETTVNITDDDLPAVTVSYQQSSYTVSENSSVTVKVTLSAAPERTVTIPITRTNQAGASNADYSGVPSSLTFNSGDTEKSFTFSATQDADNDDNESVKLGFGTLPTGVSAGTTNETTVNITDDDLPSVTVGYQQSSYTVSENSSVTVKVTLNAAPERTVTIPITRTNQAGASNADYSGVPSSLTFNSGDTEKSFTFSATQDADNDDNESVKLGFGTLPTGVSAGTTNETTVNITDDDLPSVTVGYQQSSYSVDEGSSVAITMTLSAAPERTVTIPIARTNQGGASNADYSGVPSSLTFNSGDTEKSFTFSATQDTDNDDNESVKLGFGTLPTGVSAGTTNETTVNITDDDVSVGPTATCQFELPATEWMWWVHGTSWTHLTYWHNGAWKTEPGKTNGWYLTDSDQPASNRIAKVPVGTTKIALMRYDPGVEVYSGRDLPYDPRYSDWDYLDVSEICDAGSGNLTHGPLTELSHLVDCMDAHGNPHYECYDEDDVGWPYLWRYGENWYD